MSSTHLTCRRRSVSAAIISLLVFCAAAKSHHRQGSPVNGCYRVYPEHQSKLKCPHVGYVSAFAEDVFTPGLKLLQGFQHVVMVQTSGNDSNLLIVFYVQIVPDDFVMQLHRF